MIVSVLAAACSGEPMGMDTSSGSGASGGGSSTVGTGGTGSTASSSSTSGTGGSLVDDVLVQLNAIPGLSASESGSEVPGYRYFEIDFDQPVDHEAPNGQRFTQRLRLHHRDEAAPLVLASTGYYLFLPITALEEPTVLLDGNQLTIEHRYFDPSRPSPADWSKLDVKQAAADMHRIVEALRPLYTGKWISTGASKGGMTSVYHRRFHPDDVDGTVAYVAPHSDGVDDHRYVDFLEQVGDAACRQKLKDFQREVLLRRTAMIDRMEEDAASYGVTYDLIGIGPSFESTVVSLEFAFWQYQTAAACAQIPSSTASDDDVWSFFDTVGLPLFSADPWLLGFEPYYWQAATQLGSPASDTAHLDDLLQIDFDTIDSLPSIDESPVFDPAAMQDVGAWVASEGSRILFIYGETDPWTAGAFDLGGAKESYELTMPAGNHSANILGLVPADRDTALAALEAWSGVKPLAKSMILPPRFSPPLRFRPRKPSP
ncbi:putative secreted tripeptidyl aminopeptidase [Minicystis rosea]|nr:putative secreted tripeptidyl aminopeptidase [Minicystis rosea]